MLTCCCPGCRTGYPETKRSKHDLQLRPKPKHSLHIFPKDEGLRRKWLQSINREMFVPSKYSRVCSRHFDNSCFRMERRDKNIYRSRTKASTPLRINVLKPDAIPTIFPDAPGNASGTPAPPPSATLADLNGQDMLENATAVEQAGRTVEEKTIIHGHDTIFVVVEDAIIRFEDIQEKLVRSVMPPGVQVLYGEESALFMSLSNSTLSLDILYALRVSSDLSYQIFLHGSLLSYHEVHHICPSKFIRCISDIYNILAFLRNAPLSIPPSNVQKAAKLLEEAASSSQESGSNKLGFILEQLHHHLKKNSGSGGHEIFSPQLLDIATSWQNISPNLYNQILQSDLMYLPPASHLKKYTSDISAFHEGVQPSVKIEYTINQQ